jgi:hypothetical protein
MPTISVRDIEQHHPDILLPPDPEFVEPYAMAAARGKRAASHLRVAFVAICRNAMPFLPRTLAMIEQIGSLFDQSSVFIYENDSADGTKQCLSEWAGEGRHFESKDNGLPHLNYTKSSERTFALASYRNKCREWVIAEKPHVDYVVVFDTDPWGGISRDGVLNTIGHLESEDYSSAAGMASYSWCEWGKPVWARPTICHYDAWACRWNWWTERENMIWFHLWHPPVGSPPVRMNSAFGQLAVYRAGPFMAGRYDGGDCEHVAFHKSLGGDFYLNPSMRAVSFWDLTNGTDNDRDLHGDVLSNVDRRGPDENHRRDAADNR